MTAVLLSNFVWEGPSGEMAGVAALDGHIYKQLDTGESYIRRAGSWQFVNLGLSFIKATKSGKITTDTNGFHHVTFVTPFSNNLYSVTLSCENTVPKEFPIAVFENLTAAGFDIYSYDTSKKAVLGNVVTSWLATRDYNP